MPKVFKNIEFSFVLKLHAQKKKCHPTSWHMQSRVVVQTHSLATSSLQVISITSLPPKLSRPTGLIIETPPWTSTRNMHSNQGSTWPTYWEAHRQYSLLDTNSNIYSILDLQEHIYEKVKKTYHEAGRHLLMGFGDLSIDAFLKLQNT